VGHQLNKYRETKEVLKPFVTASSQLMVDGGGNAQTILK
jgi:hypothetical protein